MKIYQYNLTEEDLEEDYLLVGNLEKAWENTTLDDAPEYCLNYPIYYGKGDEGLYYQESRNDIGVTLRGPYSSWENVLRNLGKTFTDKI